MPVIFLKLSSDLGKITCLILLTLMSVCISVVPHQATAQNEPFVPPRARCPSTPFNCDIENAINLGLQYTRSRVSNNQLGDYRHNFFGVLSLLEKRRGIGWNGPALGYDGSDPADQVIVESLVRGQIGYYGSHTNPNVVPYNYSVGYNWNFSLSCESLEGGVLL